MQSIASKKASTGFGKVQWRSVHFGKALTLQWSPFLTMVHRMLQWRHRSSFCHTCESNAPLSWGNRDRTVHHDTFWKDFCIISFSWHTLELLWGKYHPLHPSENHVEELRHIRAEHFSSPVSSIPPCTPVTPTLYPVTWILSHPDTVTI